MSRRGEPVKHTCPDIDRLIKTVTEIVAGMDFCKEEDTMEDTLSLMSDWKAELESLGIGKWSELETLRNSNHSLREWGVEMYEDAENMEKERDDFENKLADLSNEKELLVEQIASKEFEIENLQETIVDLNDKLVNNGF